MRATTQRELYERGLTVRQIESLRCGLLKPVLDLVKSNTDYQIEFRNKYFNVYYKGGSLFRIKGTDEPTFSFASKYCINNKSKYKKQIEDLKKTDIVGLVKNIDWFIYEMNAWFEEHPKKERQMQQKLCIHNRVNENELYIVDIEYAATGNGRADILTVKRLASGIYKIYLIEYKQGNGAISSRIIKNADGKTVATESGLFKHYLDAARLVEGRKQAIINTVANSMKTRNELGISNFDLSNLAFDDEIEMLFVLSEYKENTRVYRNPLVSDNLKKELTAIEEAYKELGLKYTIIQLDKECYKIKI